MLKNSLNTGFRNHSTRLRHLLTLRTRSDKCALKLELTLQLPVPPYETEKLFSPAEVSRKLSFPPQVLGYRLRMFRTASLLLLKRTLNERSQLKYWFTLQLPVPPMKRKNSFLRRSSAGALWAPRTCSHAGEKSFEVHLFVRRKKGLLTFTPEKRV